MARSRRNRTTSAGSVRAPKVRAARTAARSVTATRTTEPTVATSVPPPAVPVDDGAKVDLSAPELYLNRELTWLAFNRRVLHEAEDPRNPLLERLKFLAIASGTIDEFIMKRIGGLKQQVLAGVQNLTVDGRSPQEQITECYQVMRALKRIRESTLITLTRELAKEGIRLERWADLTPELQKEAREHYLTNIFPLVTPQAMDPAHPFPFVSNMSLNLLVTLKHADSDLNTMQARVKVPVGQGIPRFLKVGTGYNYVRLEDVMANNLDLLFPGMHIEDCDFFRVTRNADVERDEESADDLSGVDRDRAPRSQIRPDRHPAGQLFDAGPAARHALGGAGARRDPRCLRGRRNDWHARPDGDRDPRHPRAPRPAPLAGGPPGSLPRPQRVPPDQGRGRDPGPPPLRVLRHERRALPPRGEQGPQGPRDQDHALSHQRGLEGDRPPDQRGPEWQAGRGGGGAQGALRRAGQHSLGGSPGVGGHPRHLRRGRAQDARQGRPRRAPGFQRAPSLCPPRHRQLPLRHRASLQRPRPLHL